MENYTGALIGIIVFVIYRFTLGNYLRKKIKKYDERKSNKH